MSKNKPYDIKIGYNYTQDSGTCDPQHSSDFVINGINFTITFADGNVVTETFPITDYSGDISLKADDTTVLHKTGLATEVILGNDTPKPLSDFATSAQGVKADTAIQQAGMEAYIASLNLPTDANVQAIANDLSAHLLNLNNPHQVTKAQVGLSNVDNTSDVNKPVSTAQQTSIDNAKNAAISHANAGLSGKVSKVTGSRLIDQTEVDKLAIYDEEHYQRPVLDVATLTAIPEANLSNLERRFVESKKQDYYYFLSALTGTVKPDDQTNSSGFWISIEDILKSEDIWKDVVDLATTSNITLSGEQTIDGILTSNSIILVKDQTDATLNGLYQTSATGWTRLNTKLTSSVLRVKKGTLNGNQIFLNINDSITLGTTPINFTSFIAGVVENQIVGGVTTKAPAQDAVFDALALKINKTGDQTTGSLTLNGIVDPAAPTITNVGTAGSTTYSYYIVAENTNGDKTNVSPVGSTATGNATLSATNYNTITWTGISGAVKYYVLKGDTSTLLGESTGTSLDDTGQATSAFTPPTRNNTADVVIGGKAFSEGIELLNTRASNLASDLTEQEKTAIKEKIGVERSLHQTYFKRTGEDLYILSKFDSTRDIQIRFRKCMANELYTFQRVGLLSNATEEIDLTNIDTAPDIVTLAEVGTDLIGPISISGYGFIGANHFLNNDGTTKTARTNYFEIFTDDIEVKDGDSGYFNELKVIVDNTIYDPAVLPTIESLINEKVSYIIKGSRIDVSVNHYYNKGQSVNTYYGMQAQNNSTFTQLYYGHSANADVIPYDRTNGTDSGASTSYPNVEKIVMANADKSICLAMDMNKEKGLGLNTSENVDSSSLAFTATTGKAYFRLLTNKSFVAGDSYTWNGCYSWFNQAEEQALQTNTVWGYKYLNEGEESIAADFKGIATQYLRYKELIGKSFSVQSRDSTGVKSDGYFSERGLRIDSAYAESIKLKKYRELLDFSELGFGEGTPSYSSDVFAIDKNSNFYADGGATNRPNNGNGFVKTMVWGLNSNVKTQLFFEAGGSKGVYLSTTTNGVGNWSKINYGSTNSVYSGDVLAISENGMVYANLSATNKPSGVSAGYVFTQVYNSTYKTQLFFSSTTRTVFFNTQINGVSQWNELLTKTAIFDTANTFTVSPSVPTATDPSHAVPLSQVQEIVGAEEATGTAFDLSKVSGTNYNYAAASSATTYTTANPVVNGQAKGLINSASEPKVIVTYGVAEEASLQITSTPTSDGNIVVTLDGVGTNITVDDGVAEVASLQITAAASSAGDVTVTLNGVATAIAVALNDNTIQVADKIRATAFTGWTIGGSAGTDTVTFTSNTTGIKTDSTYSEGTTGATGVMTTTTQGVDPDTIVQIADRVRDTVFTGWTTGGTVGTDTVTFTSNTRGARTDATYSAGGTGATGTMTTTTQGVDDTEATKINEDTFKPNTNMEMVVESVDGINVRYYFNNLDPNYNLGENRSRKEITNTTQYTLVADDFTTNRLHFTANAGETIQLIYNENIQPLNGSLQIVVEGNCFLTPTVGTEAVGGTIQFIFPEGAGSTTIGKGAWIGSERLAANTLSFNGSFETLAQDYVLLKSPDTSVWEVSIDNTGALITTKRV